LLSRSVYPLIPDMNIMIDSTVQPVPQQTIIAIEPTFRLHLASATTRLGYLYPDLVFTIIDEGVAVTGDGEESVLRREVLHAVYREKIFAETLPLRRTLIDGLLAR
jgi:hypothetical protein